MNRIILSETEIKLLNNLVKSMSTHFTSAEDVNFLKDVGVYAHEIPRRIRIFLNDFKLLEPSMGVCLISGYPIDNHSIGCTPEHWDDRIMPSPTLGEEMLLILFGALLGDALGWVTQQKGYVVHDVLPIRDHEQSQLGTGSQQALWWHNEDAFHQYRGDYIGLMCLRNPYQVSTTFASVDMLMLDDEEKRILFEPRFFIRPDESHLQENSKDDVVKNEGRDMNHSYEMIRQLNTSPSELAVLYGDMRSPYIRIDPYFMSTRENDLPAKRALNSITQKIDERLEDIVLQPGDLLFIDNYRTVHGRKPFKARYDGTDRWLKRVNLTRDLRKSRCARPDCTSRVIHMS